MNGSTVLIYKSVGTKSPDTAGTVNTPILTGKSNFQLIRISSEFFFRCSLKSLHKVECHGKIILQNLFCTCLALRTLTPGRTRCMYLTVDCSTCLEQYLEFLPIKLFSLWASIFSQMLTESSHTILPVERVVYLRV